MTDYTLGAYDFANKLVDRCVAAMENTESIENKKDYIVEELVQLTRNRESLGFQLMIREVLDEFLEADAE